MRQTSIDYEVGAGLSRGNQIMPGPASALIWRHSRTATMKSSTLSSSGQRSGVRIIEVHRRGPLLARERFEIERRREESGPLCIGVVGQMLCHFNLHFFTSPCDYAPRAKRRG